MTNHWRSEECVNCDLVPNKSHGQSVTSAVCAQCSFGKHYICSVCYGELLSTDGGFVTCPHCTEKLSEIKEEKYESM